MDFIKVSKEEFVAFVKGYPTKLEYDVTGICEPPIGSYNDFSTGKVWPGSMVAKVILNEAMSGHPAYGGEPNDYYIMARQNAVGAMNKRYQFVKWFPGCCLGFCCL